MLVEYVGFVWQKKSEINSKFKESDFLVRTSIAHKRHINAAAKHPSYARMYGIQRSCVIEDLNHFDVTSCLPPDIMHDLLEGVCSFSYSSVIHNIQLFCDFHWLNDGIDD